MRNYKYTAIDLHKKKYSGLFVANDEKDLAAQLARQNLFLVSCQPYSGRSPSAFFTLGTGTVSVQELTLFCRQFSVMITSGIPVIECLEALRTQKYSAYFRNLLAAVYEDVKSGVVLSEALNKHKKAFPDFFRNMVHVGEVGGTLDTVFEALAQYYENEDHIRKKVKSALSYPLFLLAMTVGIVILMLVFIIPTFKNTLASLEVTATGYTKFVYDVSDFLVANWLYVLAVIVLIVVVIYAVLKTKKGKEGFDWLMMRTPIVGRLQTALFCGKFARSFSLLLSGGMDAVEALDEVSVIIGNTDIKRRYKMAVEEIRHGISMEMAFSKQKIFSPILLQMIAVGEKTAEMENVLQRSCDFFDNQSEAMLLSATGKIQPVMLIIMGAVIASLFIAVYSPMLSIMTSLT